MSDKYKITGEELNQILMHSPHALSTSPTERGMSGDQIKRFFYDFIKVFAGKLNLHLGDVEEGIEDTSKSLMEEISLHNEGETAHADIRSNVESAQKDAEDAYKRAEAAFNLALGKSKVYICMDFDDVVGHLAHEYSLNEGDFLMVTEAGCPDFVVASGKYKKMAESVSVEMTQAGTLPAPEVGKMYYCEATDRVIIAIESGIDTSAFATREYVEGVAKTLGDALNRKISEHIEEETSHADIRSVADTAQKDAQTALGKAEAALDLASGRTRIHVVPSFYFMVADLINIGAYAGDVYLILEEGVPDFIVVGNGELEGAVHIYRDDLNDLPTPLPGGKYFVEGISVAAIESGIDTSAIASREYVDSLVGDVNGVLDLLHDYAEALKAGDA